MGRRAQQLPGLIIFDLDGTLIDTEPTSVRAWIDAARESGLDLSRGEVLSFIGLNNKAIEVLAKERYGPDIPFAEIFSRKRQLCHAEFAKGVRLKPGVRELLDTLDALSIRACIATSSGKDRSRSFLEELGLLQRFEFLVSGEEVTHSKPHPEIFLRCLEEAGVLPEDALVVEDSKNGILGARRSGAGVILIPDVVAVDEEMAALADHQFESMFELRDFLTDQAQTS